MSNERCTGNVGLGKTTEVRENGLTYVIDDHEELKKIERIKSWKIDGLTQVEIQKKCEAEGVTTRTGKAPTLSTIKKWTKGIKSKKAREPKKANLKDRKARGKVADAPSSRGLSRLVVELKDRGLSWRLVAEEIEKIGYVNSKGNPHHFTQLVRIYKDVKSQKKEVV